MTEQDTIQPVRLGTFAGVFTPTVLTILGAIMYLRTGWVVGNAGLGGAILIVVLAHVITITTGLAVSSIASNVRVGAGGAFAIISQALGVEVGGSVGVPLYLAQAISVALYVLAFAEGWQGIDPGRSMDLVAWVALGIVFAIAFVSTRSAARTQFAILAIVVLSLISIFAGGLPGGGAAGERFDPQWWGDFGAASFWETFAIYFPAVTGIMAGISLSGVLRKPRENIPRGTMSAVGLTLAVYLALTVWLAIHVAPSDLLDNYRILVDRAWWGPVVLAGILGATFSSALGSLVAAPRVLQALAMRRAVPAAQILAREDEKGEARPALIVSAVVAGITLAIALGAGGLDAVAQLITMFFLLTYAMLNVVVLIEQSLGMVSFRPTFRIPRIVPLAGLGSCLFVMFLVNPTFSLVSIGVVLALYGLLVQRSLPPGERGDVRSGMFRSIARWATRQVERMPQAPERTWQPDVLAPVTSIGQWAAAEPLIRDLTGARGSVLAVGLHPPGDRQAVDALPERVRALRSAGIFSRTALLEQTDIIGGAQAGMELLGATFFRPNLMLLSLTDDGEPLDVTALAATAEEQRMALALLFRHPQRELGARREVVAWIHEQGPEWRVGLRMGNLDLMLLLGYQLARAWSGRLILRMTVSDPDTRERAERYLEELIELGRLERWAEADVCVAGFDEALAETPPGDLALLGLPRTPDVGALRQLADAVEGSCLFVRGSGDESVLA